MLLVTGSLSLALPIAGQRSARLFLEDTGEKTLLFQG